MLSIFVVVIVRITWALMDLCIDAALRLLHRGAIRQHEQRHRSLLAEQGLSPEEIEIRIHDPIFRYHGALKGRCLREAHPDGDSAPQRR
jgi:hypothetical protein